MVPKAFPRLPVIDVARGVALLAMTLFHFGWDLEMFGFAERGFASQPAMKWFARAIASSFLFLVGVSLVLAHANGLRLQPFLRRLALVAGAALLITIATWFATPDIYIFFGILHHIALASILALPFLRLTPLLTFAAALIVFVLALYGRSEVFNDPWWWWTGLNAFTPRSSDYVPLFPFFAAVLTGIATTKLALSMGLQERLSAIQANGPAGRMLRFIGRNSLAYYLLHQPVMISILFVVAWTAGRI